MIIILIYNIIYSDIDNIFMYICIYIIKMLQNFKFVI